MTKEELLASLLLTADEDAVTFDEEFGEGRYIDWSVISEEGGRRFEVGAGGTAVHLELSWSEIERLQKALTVSLLKR